MVLSLAILQQVGSLQEHKHRRRKDDTVNIYKLVGVLLGIIGGIVTVIGGTITIGDRLWADKMTVAKIETTVENIKDDVAETKRMQTVVYKAFMEAARHAPHVENERHAGP